MNTNTIKIQGNKNKLLAISLILIFAIGIGLTFVPSGSAQPGITMPIQTYGYISAAPPLVGVGQQMTINAWVAPPPIGYSGSAWFGSDLSGAQSEPGFLGVSVTFTRPDGTEHTFMPLDLSSGNLIPGQTEVLATLAFFYTPNMAGNWSVTMSMPAQNLTDSSGTVLYTACSSSPAYFTVTTEHQNAGLLDGWPYSPLPNDNVYWTYPISANNREWASIAAPMFPLTTGQSRWQPFGTAPSTPHILWQQASGAASIIGGDMGTIGVTGAGSSPIILMGKAYIDGNCYDLTTGELLWESSNRFSRAIFLPGNPFNQGSVASGQETDVVLAGSTAPRAYLFGASGTTWTFYDPNTGAAVRTFTNATMGTALNAGSSSPSSILLTNGSPLVFGQVKKGQVDFPPYYMSVNYLWGWNMTKVVGNDWYTGLMWMQNVSSHVAGVYDPAPGDGIGRTQGFVISADMSTIAIGGSAGNYLTKGFSTADGHSVWNVSLGYVGLSSTSGQLAGTNKFVTYYSPQGTYRCYSILTGELLWTSTNAGTLPWHTQSYDHANDADNMYIPSMDGSVIALSLADGHKVWQSEKIPTKEVIHNVLPASTSPIVAGGFVYQRFGYPTAYQQQPVPRFSVLKCLNATTGETVWTLNGACYPTAEANGYLTTNSAYDGKISCIGKGQTSTSISIQNNVISLGHNMLVEGNVLDQSPAQPGTPAVSDASMSEWMDYLHMQNATLLNNAPTPKGVEVQLTAIDPNNNYITIGTTTTNAKGNFYYDWTPPSGITGNYVITASFVGSESYWPSSGETGCVVTEAPAQTPTPPPPAASLADQYFVPGIIGIIVAIIVVGVVLIILVLKKR